MTAIYWRVDPALQRIRDSKHASIIWTQGRTVGVYFDYRDGAWVTHGLTSDARVIDLRRYEADSALSGLGRVIREHEKLCDDPLLRWALFYVAMDYLVDLWSKHR